MCWIPHQREVYEESAVAELVEKLGRRVKSNARLPCTAGPRQRENSDIGSTEHRRNLGELALPPDQRRRLRRKVRRSARECGKRREVAIHAFGDELEDPLGPSQVLEPVLSEVDQRVLRREVVLHQLSRGLGKEHLAAVPGSGEAGPSMNVHPGVAFCGSERLAGMNSHPHPHRSRDESALGIGRGSDGICGSGESDEKGIALRVDLDPAVLSESASQDAPVLGEDVRVPLPELVEQPRRALDVREEEGDGPGRQLGHARVK
jgi:hypothetical protein